MAVTRISPVAGKEASFGLITQGSAKRSWLVLTNNRYDDEITVAQAGINQGIFPIPFLSRHPTSPILLCRKLNPVQDHQWPTKWVVTAEYSSEPLTQSQAQMNFVPPLDRPAIIKRRKNKYIKALQRDANDKAYVNSAGDPFDPPREVPRGRPLVNIQKNIGFVPSQMSSLGDAINSSAFICQNDTILPYQARIDDWDLSELQTEQDANGNLWSYYIFTWSFEVDAEEGWLTYMLDRGYRARRKGGDGVSLYNILDKSTPPQPVSAPALLDGNGYELANPGNGPGQNAPVFLGPFQDQTLFDFNQLPLS